ncbi:MAG: sigma-70 family RNA polymerase sigma factor [Butyrivibrio sp.]|nr:sigma-70 family RNA polymerase sigma factor [Acetatifactor muris]MCM1558707.1 sigma-70 family RNA polymerase sigma factor [Butyrivibrio sp.]
MKSVEDLNRVMESYGDMVRRICFVHLKNRHDTEDVCQNVYMKYLLHTGFFENAEHEKAWFARVTINACTDLLRSLSRRRWVPLEVIAEEKASLDNSSAELLEIVLKLPEKYRNVIYLHYYEEYTAAEIAGILGKKENTVYTWLSRAKNILRDQLGGEWHE